VEGDYSLENLIEIFSSHAEKSDENNVRLRNSFVESNPEMPIPEVFLDPFNIARALYHLCREMKEIKDKIGVT
jgi:hypothetical protein